MHSVRLLVIAALYIAIGLIVSPLIYVDVGFAKVFPIQHMLNVCIAVTLGTYYNLLGSFALSTLRILLGVGTIMAYPGSMFGALLAGLFYRYTKNTWMASLGEVIGTGIIGSLVAFAIARLVLQTSLGALAFVLPFALSSIGGALLAQVVLRLWLPRQKVDKNSHSQN